MTDNKLYMTYRSPYARKVRLAFYEKEIPFEEISLDLFNLPSDYLAKNPAGTVPALETGEGKILSDSTLILHYLEFIAAEKSLLPSDKDLLFDCWNWEEYADRLCDQQVLSFFENKKSNPNPAVLDKVNRISKRLLSAFEKRLGNQKTLYSRLTYADLAWGAVLKWMEFRLGWNCDSHFEAIPSFLEALDQRDSFKKTIPSLD